MAQTTLQAALRCAAQPLATASGSASVAALTEGVLKDMYVIKLKIAAGILAATVFLAGSGWAVQQALADKPAEPAAQEQQEPATAVVAAPAEKGPHASKLDLTAENCTKIGALIRPQGNEWRHLKIKWYTDLAAARKKAAREDKPILIFRTGGAGYNDPLGQC